MTRTAWAALATVAVLAAIYAHMLNQPRRPWDEYGDVDVDSEPITPARAWCNHAGCNWETTNPSTWGRMNDYLNHRDADHE